MTDKDSPDLSALYPEILLGMRAQSTGRDQNALIDHMRSLPAGMLDYDFIISDGTVVRIEDPVPPSLLGDSWCVIPRNKGSVICRSRSDGQEVPGELVRGVCFEEAQDMGAFLYADAGACVELVYPQDIPLPEQPKRHQGVTPAGHTTFRHGGGFGEPEA